MSAPKRPRVGERMSAKCIIGGGTFGVIEPVVVQHVYCEGFAVMMANGRQLNLRLSDWSDGRWRASRGAP